MRNRTVNVVRRCVNTSVERLKYVKYVRRRDIFEIPVEILNGFRRVEHNELLPCV